MDSIFGIGGLELLLILILATVILGPLRMIQAARTVGRLMRDLRNYYSELSKGFSEELAILAETQEAFRNQVSDAMPKPDEFQIPPLTLDAGEPAPPSTSVELPQPESVAESQLEPPPSPAQVDAAEDSTASSVQTGSEPSPTEPPQAAETTDEPRDVSEDQDKPTPPQ